MNSKLLYQTVIVIALFMVFATKGPVVSAASYTVSTSVQKVERGDTVAVDVQFDAEGQSINALAGTLVFDPSQLILTAVDVKDSIITNWLITPAVGSSSMSWSGIIPGGFEGVRSPYYQGFKPGKVAEATFTALAAGSTSLSFTDVSAYPNDGTGIAVSVRANRSTVAIDQGTSSTIQMQKPPDSSNTIKWYILGVAGLFAIVIFVYLKKRWSK